MLVCCFSHTGRWYSEIPDIGWLFRILRISGDFAIATGHYTHNSSIQINKGINSLCIAWHCQSSLLGCPRWIRTTTSRSRIWRANRYTMKQFVMREGLEPTTGCFVDSCSDPTELPHHLRKQKDSRSTFGRFARKEPPEPGGSARSCFGKRLLRRRASSVPL